jgi:hypothetical protein
MSKTDQSDIDKKKQKIKPDKKINIENTYNYGMYLFRQLITLGIIIVVGTGIVYSSKAFLCDIIPVNTKYFPYTDIFSHKTNETKEVSINILKMKDNKNYSTKLVFPKEDNEKILESGLFGYLRKLKNKNVYLLYLCSVIQDILATNLQLNKSVYNAVNSVFTESINIFLTPLLFVFWCTLMFFINFAHILFSLLKNLKLLFSTQEKLTKISLFSNPLGYIMNLFSSSSEDQEEEDDLPKKWKTGSITSGYNIFITMIYIILLIIFTVFFGIGIVYPFISIFSIIFCFTLPLFMVANDVKKYDKPVKYTFKNALGDVLKYKSQVIMLIISYFIISGANTYFGNVVTAISFAIFLIMYFFTPLFETYKLNYKDNLTPGIIDSTTKYVAGNTSGPLEEEPLPLATSPLEPLPQAQAQPEEPPVPVATPPPEPLPQSQPEEPPVPVATLEEPANEETTTPTSNEPSIPSKKGGRKITSRRNTRISS